MNIVQSGLVAPGVINASPNLAPLANNGGPTQTMSLLPGSPAFNAGNNAVVLTSDITDQRGAGFARINGGTVDIGAFEVLNTAPTAVTFANPLISINENSSTASRIKMADIMIADDGYGTSALSLSGTDQSFFELDGSVLYLKAETVLDFEAKSSYSVRVNVDDTTVGGTPDAFANFLLTVLNVNEMPVVTGPGSPISNQSPTFTWVPDAAAASYDIWFSNLTTGQVVRANTTNTSWTPDSPIGIGQYRFWARGKTSGGSVSPWSVPVTFRVVTPVSLSPMDIRQNSQRPTVSWGALKGAATYEVWLSDVTNNNSSLIRENAGSATSWTPSVDLPIASYRVWVRGIDSKGIAARWSTGSALVVAAAPVATESLQSTFSRTPTFSWSVVWGAVSYSLWLRNQSTGEIKNLTGISDTTWTPTASISDGNWIWRVQATNASGYRTFWSQSAQLYVGGRPQILAPTGSNVSAQPLFQWTPVSGAASYSLIVTRSVDSVNVIRQTALTATSYTSPTTLQAGTYRAWVRAVSTSGEVSLWSRSFDFTVAANAPKPLMVPSSPHPVSTPLLALLATNRNVNDASPRIPAKSSDQVGTSENRRLSHEAVGKNSSATVPVNGQNEQPTPEKADLLDSLFALDPGFVIEHAGHVMCPVAG